MTGLKRINRRQAVRDRLVSVNTRSQQAVNTGLGPIVA
jgi:hypothetical protein